MIHTHEAALLRIAQLRRDAAAERRARQVTAADGPRRHGQRDGTQSEPRSRRTRRVRESWSRAA